MKKVYFLLPFLLLCSIQLLAQDAGDEAKKMSNEVTHRDEDALKEAREDWWTQSMENHDQRMAWWREARFGMFIHWGVYSVAGGEWKGKKVSGYAEHLMRKEQITKKEYLELAHKFNPTGFDADQWVKTAKAAGMRYLIITAKHHDGFAMYPSDYSTFDIHDQTPFQRDPMAELSAACKKYGLKFGFYYSHAFDWEHPDAPGNDWEYHNPGGDKNLYGGRDWYNLHPELLLKVQKYVNEKAILQIQELLRKYHPDILWFDTPQKLPLSENLRILKAIRAVDHNVVVNGRLVRGSGFNFGDYINTADRPAEFFPAQGDWEAIPTTNESYGYSKFDSSHKPASHFIKLLANAASRGGNLLLNIGPMGNGVFDPKDQRILDSLAIWTKQYGSSIYATKKSPIPFQSWGVATQKKEKVYLHVFSWPKDGRLYVGGLNGEIEGVHLMGQKVDQQLKINRLNRTDFYIQVPLTAPDPVDAVIVLKLKSSAGEMDSLRYVSTNIPETRLLAFDAALHGGGLGFGDGKAKRYYIDGWKDKNQFLAWDFRTPSPQKFKVILKYVTDKTAAGSGAITLDQTKHAFQIPKTDTGNEIKTIDLGIYPMLEGKHLIRLELTKLTSEEFMRILEVDLFPVN